MKARNFKQVNIKATKENGQCLTLPAFVTQENMVVSFKLSEKEIQQVIETGTIYINLLHNKKPITPIISTVLNPFIKHELVCPEDGMAFGVDTDESEACDDCSLFDACWEKQNKMK